MLWVFIGLLIGTLGLNELLFRFSGKNLNYSNGTDKKAYEIGEDISLTPVIENKKAMSVPFLRIDEYFDNALSEDSLSYSLFVLPFQRVKRTYHIQGSTRGLWEIQSASIRMEDFLGFHRSYREVSLKIPVVILPQKKRLRDIILPYSSLYGPLSVKRWIIEDPLMIRGIREYTGSESERHIHWASSLKHDRLMVKEFDFTSERSALVFLNLESNKPYWKDADIDAIEEAIVSARSVMEELTQEKVPYGFASNGYNPKGKAKGYYFPPGVSAKNLGRYNEILGKMGTVIGTPLEDALKNLIRNRNAFQTFILVTPVILPEYIKPLKEFARSFGKTVVISMQPHNLEKLPKTIEIYKGVNTLGNHDS
ncbi:MAG: DUF58 domain-containing protein [Clostridium sp.]|nr:DUF58 domain-containing protein [Clostridium sp.]